MLLSIASAKGSPGASTTCQVLAAVWPKASILADLDPTGSDLLYRLRSATGAPLEPEHGLLSLATAIRRRSQTHLLEHTTRVEGGLDVLIGLPRPEQTAAIGPGWGALADYLRTDRDVLCDVGRLTPGTPSLPVALNSEALLLVVRPGVDAYGHLRDRIRWIEEETALREQRPFLGVVLIAPWKARHEKEDLERLLRSTGLDVPVLGPLVYDLRAADALAGRQANSLRRSLLVRSATALADELYSRMATLKLGAV
ncbi:Uncharacterised protein [Actinomyces bovis]|uniref:Flp pilus assembly protein, ATPase CpaE n=1 Tax=Actinomyces bovis TaxID=1658 RepID=A0ABY1VQE8_9ACTO|nr:hypothetical protein [Actinomyces bovis]SPT53622.1 Uncharacterised protein [Actinomyces bovis]VEG55675.1 Uncharacterised protein [Actinomyces israelii]